MGIVKKNKLNQLLRQWPDGKINSSQWLTSKGYGANFIQKYKNNNWIEAIGSGAYKKSQDVVDWASALECIQEQLKAEVYVGGKSAIELAGKAQYIKIKLKSITLLCKKKEFLPSWMKNKEWTVKLDFKMKNIFRNVLTFGEKQSGFITINFDKSSIIISSPERAYLEYLAELPNISSYTEAKEILENLISLRSSLLQNLLENCTSLKVKRLFLHFAETINHPWYKKIDLTKVELGKGKRVIFKNGVLDKKFNITVPNTDIT